MLPKSLKFKMNKRQIAALVLSAALLCLNASMIYGVRKNLRYYELDKTHHEKLALAYHLSGRPGVEYELKTIAKYEKTSEKFVADTTEKLDKAKDPGQTLKELMAADRKEIKDLRTKRNVVSGIIYFVIAAQIFLNMRNWWKDNRHHFSK